MRHLAQPLRGLDHVRVGRLAGEHRVEQRAHRKEIAAVVDVLRRLELLGRHEAQLSLGHADLRQVRPVSGARDAEVEQLHRALGRHHHVRGGDVAVHQVERAALVVGELVRVGERLAELSHDAKRGGEGEGHLLVPGLQHQVRERHARHMFHGDEVLALDLAQLEDLADVRVGEPRCQPRLVEEHLDEPRVAQQFGEHALDHQLLAEAGHAGLPGEKYFGHASAAQRAHELVAAHAGLEFLALLSLSRRLLGHASRLRLSPSP